MRILLPALCQQGQVYQNYWLSSLEAQKAAAAHNSEVYRKIEDELTQKITQQIPGFSMENPEHVRLLQNSRALPQNQQMFQQAYQRECIDLNFYAMMGETLLARGRNHAAQVALTQGFDKLLFIDCDEGYSFNDIKTLIFSGYPVAAGVVPLKTYPVPGTFKTSLNYLPFLDDEMFFDGSLRTLEATQRMARAKKSKWIKVAFTGTGFMCLDVSVFAKLAETAEEYMYPNPMTGNPEVHWAFFDGGPMNGIYFSEDWCLCDKIRDLGIDIMVNIDVRADHMGPHKFVAG